MPDTHPTRRDMFAALAAAAAPQDAQKREDPSLYIPKAHLVEDRKLLHDFMDEFSFVSLVTASPAIHITHIPTLFERGRGSLGTVYGHIAKHNPQSETFDGQQRAVIVFEGPQSYITPTWYAGAQVVPTWNFAVVHASGRLKPIADKKALHDLLARLIQKYEGPKNTSYDFGKLPDSYTYPMIENIIGFEMEVELLEGKFKLGQERSAADRAGILKGLETARPARSLHDLTADFYRSHT